jgi:hypothetical protein
MSRNYAMSSSYTAGSVKTRLCCGRRPQHRRQRGVSLRAYPRLPVDVLQDHKEPQACSDHDDR